MSLEKTTRLYERTLVVASALLPAVAIWYLTTFSSAPQLRFEDHGFHEIAIAVATLVGAFISYVSWRSYRESGEIFLRWLTAGFLAFTLIYAPHGLLTRTAHHNIWLFLLYGPVSRFVMLSFLVIGLAQYGKPRENPLAVSEGGFWRHIIWFCVIVNLAVAVLAYSPVASNPWVRTSLESSAVILCLLGIAMMGWRRIESPLMMFYGIGLAFFAQAAVAFMLGKPWSHMWWLAHAIFAGGFLVLSWGVARALLTTRSFAMAYSQEKMMRALEREKSQTEAANQALHASETRLLAVFNGVQDCVITIDAMGLIQSFNHSAETVFGYHPEEVIGRNVSMLMPEPYRSAHDGYLLHHRNTGEFRAIGALRELIALRKDGSVFPMEMWVNKTVIDNEPLFTCSLRDISVRKAMQDAVNQLAFYDPLTKLPNRRLLDDRLTQVMANAKRNGSYSAVIFLDLDNFKPLNDFFGHEVGDLLLVEVAARLKGCLRERDTVARFGGDEFIIVVDELGSQRAEADAQASRVAQKILAALCMPFQLQTRGDVQQSETIAHQCTASIGVFVFAGSGERREVILKRADSAMYEAKAAGRNQIRFAT